MIECRKGPGSLGWSSDTPTSVPPRYARPGHHQPVTRPPTGVIAAREHTYVGRAQVGLERKQNSCNEWCFYYVQYPVCGSYDNASVRDRYLCMYCTVYDAHRMMVNPPTLPGTPGRHQPDAPDGCRHQAPAPLLISLRVCIQLPQTHITRTQR